MKINRIGIFPKIKMNSAELKGLLLYKVKYLHPSHEGKEQLQNLVVLANDKNHAREIYLHWMTDLLIKENISVGNLMHDEAAEVRLHTIKIMGLSKIIFDCDYLIK